MQKIKLQIKQYVKKWNKLFRFLLTRIYEMTTFILVLLLKVKPNWVKKSKLGEEAMLKFLRKITGTVILGVVVSTAPMVANAEMPVKPDGFPERPITMIVPFGPGGGSDQMGRAISGPMSDAMGVPIQVINKPGGGGRAALPDFMSAPADGYTLLQFSDDVFTHYPAGRIKENPTVDWTPIGLANIVFSQIYMNADDDRFSDWQSFVAYAKNNEVKVANVSHKGSMELISISKIEEVEGIKTQQISYDKPAERYAALIGKHVDVLFEQPSDVSSLLDSGRIKPILTILRNRPAAFPDVASLSDIGLDWAPLLRVRGIFVHGSVPQERKAYLEAAMKEAYETKEFQGFLEKKFMTAIKSYSSSNEATKIINDMIDTYRKAYKDLGIN